MLKRQFITMLVCMIALGTMAQEGKFTVKGTFEGRKDSVTIAIRDVTNWETIAEETLPITGEMHELTFDLNDAALLYVTDVKGLLTTVIPAIPGETVLFYQNENKVTHLGGSQFYVDYDEAQHYVGPLLLGINECNDALSGKYGPLYPDEYNLYSDLNFILNDRLNDYVHHYVESYPDRDAAAALIFLFAFDPNEIERTAAMLTERARNSVAANLYKAVNKLTVVRDVKGLAD